MMQITMAYLILAAFILPRVAELSCLYSCSQEMRIEQFDEAPRENNRKCLCSNSWSLVFCLMVVTKLLVLFFDVLGKLNVIHYVEQDVESKYDADHNGVSDCSKLKRQEDLCQSTEEFKCAHHQNEVCQQSVFDFDLVGNCREEEQYESHDEEGEVHQLHVLTSNRDTLVSPELRHVTRCFSLWTFAEA